MAISTRVGRNGRLKVAKVGGTGKYVKAKAPKPAHLFVLHKPKKFKAPKP